MVVTIEGRRDSVKGKGAFEKCPAETVGGEIQRPQREMTIFKDL
jgi:hypothetical protein